MQLWFVTPARQRYHTARVAFAQRQALAAELAPAGVTAHTVVLSDDRNLDIAEGHGFHTVHSELPLGGRLSLGIEYALDHSADWVCFAGNDNLLHRSLFKEILTCGRKPPVYGTRRMAMVDLHSSNLRGAVLHVNGDRGCPPWLMPRWQAHPQMVPPTINRGMEWALGRQLQSFEVREKHPWAKVDLKDRGSLTRWGALAGTSLVEEQVGSSVWPLSVMYDSTTISLLQRVNRRMSNR